MLWLLGLGLAGATNARDFQPKIPCMHTGKKVNGATPQMGIGVGTHLPVFGRWARG